MNNIYLRLFYTFFKIGAFTFGGGWAMIALIQREVVDKHHWVSKEEFVDMLAVAQSLPGILAVNFSVAIGDRLRGFKGSLVSAVGTILPSFIIILAIAMFLTPDTIKDNETLNSIFKGIRPAVVALIAAPLWQMGKSAGITRKTVVIPIAAALLIWLTGLSPIYVIIAAIVGGLAWNGIQARKALKKCLKKIPMHQWFGLQIRLMKELYQILNRFQKSVNVIMCL